MFTEDPGWALTFCCGLTSFLSILSALTSGTPKFEVSGASGTNGVAPIVPVVDVAVFYDSLLIVFLDKLRHPVYLNDKGGLMKK